MAIVLTATGLFVYQRQETNLDQTINRALRARAADVAALAQQSDTGLSDARPSGGRANRAALAQLIDASGRVLDRTPGLPGRPLLTPAAITSAFGLMGVVLVELMGFVLVETMLALLLTLSDPPTQPAFKPPYQPLQLYVGSAVAGAFAYVRDGRSAAKAEPDSAAAITIPPKIRFI